MGSFEDFCARMFYSSDDLWLILPFLWQGQIGCLVFGMGIVHGCCKKFGAKVNKSR